MRIAWRSSNALSACLLFLAKVFGFQATVDLWRVLVSGCITRAHWTHRLDHDTGDLVWVRVAGGSAVLKVAAAFLSNGGSDTDAGAAVGDTGAEGIDGARLVVSRQTQGVVGAVDGNVLFVALLQSLDGGLDVLHAAGLAHLLGRDVGVEAGAVPVPGDGLGVEGDLGAKLLGDAVQQETGHPEFVSHCLMVSASRSAALPDTCTYS